MPERHKFERLGRFYILALSGIAVIIIISQLFVQRFIGHQQNDSRIINIAGRQRMLSQKISKLSLMIRQENDLGQLKLLAPPLDEAYTLWTNSHFQLLGDDPSLIANEENSSKVMSMFEELQPSFEIMSKNTESLLDAILALDSIQHKNTLNQFIIPILETEGNYLSQMDNIVFQYDNEAKEKVSTLQKIEIILLAISLGIILIELLFIFRPLAKSIKQTIADLIKSEVASKNMTQEINKLYNELGKSYQDLESVNIEPEQPLIFLKCNDIGKITFISDKFRKIMEYDNDHLPANLVELFETNGYDSDYIKGIMKLVTIGKTWNGEIKLTAMSGDFVWLDSSIVPVANIREKKKELMVVARDNTPLKEAKLRSQELNREKIEKKVKEQEYRSVLILEGQEEERKRISREIHDGIGQMLTAMKLNMEAIVPSSSVHSRKRFDDAKHLLKNVIKEVRRVSFNLTPSSLSDFGIVPALRKFCGEVEKLSDINIIFENKSGFINRLENNIETNIYRIVQEAVNNAVKYSTANNITVTLEHDSSYIEISIIDDGKGFDYDALDKTGHFGVSGHGIFNMKERAAFINGKFNVESKINKGTHIKITIPLD